MPVNDGAPRWTPGGFERWITLGAALALFFTMTTRGADYFTGDSGDTARRLSAIEAAAPLQLWGALFLGGAVLGFTALAFGRPVLLMWAHGVGAASYAAVAVGLGIDVVERSDAPTVWAFTLAALLVLSLTVGVFAGRFASAGRYWPVVLWTAAASAGAGALTVPFDGLRNTTVFACIATLHALMLIGTAGRARRDKLIGERIYD